MNKLMNFNPATIKEEKAQELHELVLDEDFDPEVVEDIAIAAMYLTSWCLSVNKFARQYEKLRPRIVSAEAAKETLETNLKELEALEALLSVAHSEEIRAKMVDRDNLMLQLKDLESMLEKTRFKIGRVKKLLAMLKHHFKNWEEKNSKLEERSQNVIGNSIMAANIIEYLGPLDLALRQKLKLSWENILVNNRVQLNKEFQLDRFLGSKVEINNWTISGLPSTAINFENGLMLKHNRKVKMIYDPNDTCITWLQKLNETKPNPEYLFTSLTDKKLPEKLQTSLEQGLILVIDFFNGNMEGVVNNLIKKTLREVEGNKTIKIDGMWYNYDENFDFYLITRDNTVIQRKELQLFCCIIKFGVDENSLRANIETLITRVYSPEHEQYLFEMNKKFLTKSGEMYSSQEVILRRFTIHNDETLLEDEAYFRILEAYSGEMIKVEKELDEEAKRRVEAQDVIHPYHYFVQILVQLFTACQRAQDTDPYLPISPKSYLRLLANAMKTSALKSLDSFYDRELCLGLVYQVFSIVCVGGNPKNRLSHLIRLCISILKIYHEFNEDLWEFIVSDSREAKETPESEIEPGLWSTLKNLRKMIPNISMEDLPSISNAFVSKENKSMKSNLRDSLGSMTKLTALERLAISKVFLPDNIEMILELFAEAVLMAKQEPEGKSLDQLLRLTDHTQPMTVVYESCFDYPEVIALLSKALNSTVQIIFSGNCQWEKILQSLDKCLSNGSILIISDIHLLPAVHENLIKYLREVKNKYRANENFRLILTTVPGHPNMSFELLSISMKYYQEEADDKSEKLSRYLKQVNREELKTRDIKLQNIHINLIFAFFALQYRSKLEGQGTHF
jgi:hypothetical protein